MSSTIQIKSIKDENSFEGISKIRIYTSNDKPLVCGIIFPFLRTTELVISEPHFLGKEEELRDNYDSRRLTPEVQAMIASGNYSAGTIGNANWEGKQNIYRIPVSESGINLRRSDLIKRIREALPSQIERAILLGKETPYKKDIIEFTKELNEKAKDKILLINPRPIIINIESYEVRENYIPRVGTSYKNRTITDKEKITSR